MAKKSNIPDECIEITNNPIISLEEKGKKMTFRNNERKPISKIRVDGCAIKEGIRCDWLVKNEKNIEHFVELKGGDVIHGCRQLERSILELSNGAAKNVKYSFIISSRRYPAIDTTVQNWQRKFKDRFNCKLIIKNIQLEVDL
jgi:hypothetical protein